MSLSIFVLMTVIVLVLVQVQAERKVKYNVNFINEEDNSTATKTYYDMYSNTDLKRGDLLIKVKALTMINSKVRGFGFTTENIAVFDASRGASEIISANITLNVAKHLGKVN
ncbi:hypothetical protein Ddc_17953 [Ditylenchus destructor]|nr:hypothetical protein Ddc_17953 [Ditylenchus destructor]